MSLRSPVGRFSDPPSLRPGLNGGATPSSRDVCRRAVHYYLSERPRAGRRPVRFRTLALLALACCSGRFTIVAAPIFRTVGLAAGADVHTIQEAIDAVPAGNTADKIIIVQPGAFFGHTILNKPHVTLRGSGPATLLTYNLGQSVPGADGQPVTWRGAAALQITPEAHDCAIENLTLENTFGEGMQAQACVIEADRVAFRHCRILGWQDTLRLETGRQFFDRCYIAGHVDFIYGGATAFFDRCEIFCRGPGYVTAPATPAGRIGFVFSECRVTFPYHAAPTYLGRPWHGSPAATFIHCELGPGIQPAGWHEWRVPPPLIRFAEYQCTGPGAATAGRVAWAAHSDSPAPAEFARTAVLGDWNPEE
ncbi:MAG TPA: pectinesterase family protein [Opitutus sp.]|nr:pectinesterase family protein [Opitutus sp.]